MRTYRVSLAKQYSRRIVAEALLHDAPVSRADLSRTTGLSKQTTSLVIADLEAAGWVRSVGVGDLSGGQRQGIAIARATDWAKKLVLMDEPTAALGVAETAKVEKIIEALKARNVPILSISRSLDQVFRISDRICVLRRGKQIGVRETGKTDKNEIVSMIAGLST
jgi:ABC-type sugar transport system ATPase subunit